MDLVKQGIASLIVVLAAGTCVAQAPTSVDLFEQMTGLNDEDFGPGGQDADVSVPIDGG